MTKAELRKQFLAERKALSAEEVDHRSQAIAELLYGGLVIRQVGRPNLDEHIMLPVRRITNPPYCIHAFLPIIRQHEVNTWPIIHRIWRELPHAKVAVSVTDAVSQTLTHYPLTPETPLVENRWGVPEPVGNEQLAISSEKIDMVLVPLLAFDLTGHRVGYGGGYYDRFMAQCRPDCSKIGLSLFEPVEEIQNIEATDIRLDGCLTPTHTYWFSRESS